MQKAAATLSAELVKSRDQTDQAREENDAARKLREQLTNIRTGFLSFILHVKPSYLSQIFPPVLSLIIFYTELCPSNSSLLKCKRAAIRPFD